MKQFEIREIGEWWEREVARSWRPGKCLTASAPINLNIPVSPAWRLDRSYCADSINALATCRIYTSVFLWYVLDLSRLRRCLMCSRLFILAPGQLLFRRCPTTRQHPTNEEIFTE